VRIQRLAVWQDATWPESFPALPSCKHSCGKHRSRPRHFHMKIMLRALLMAYCGIFVD
jgi:hypothetical protein